MDARLQQRVQRYGWDRAAGVYEAYWREQLAPAQEETLRLADLKPGESVLDIACGTGLVSLPAAEAVGPEGKVLGADISEKMLDEVRAAAQAVGYDHLTFERMEAEELLLPDAAFDIVLCSLGLMYVTDFGGSVREMHRVTKPGGRAVAAVWGQRDRCGWAEIFPVVDARVNTEVCPLFFQLGAPDALATCFRQAGFEAVEEIRLTTRLHYESADAAVGAAFAGGPVALAYSRFDDATRDEAHAEYLESIEPFRIDDAYDIPGEFVVVRGHKPAN
jgi:ubiquinone/menaquinone biosynthesis C-methylase UbiE